jgi:hypothetical protein
MGEQQSKVAKLVIDTQCVLPVRTFVQHCLSFIDTAQLYGIISRFGMTVSCVGYRALQWWLGQGPWLDAVLAVLRLPSRLE